MDIKLQTKQIARLFDVTTATIGNYVKLGMPKEGRGRFDLFQCHRWWVENILGFEKGTSGRAETSELLDAKLRWYSARAEAAEHRLEVEKGKYLALDAVSDAWAHRVSLVVAGLESLRFRLPPVLAGKTRIEMGETIKKEVRLIREGYYQDGRYTPADPLLKVLQPCLDRLDDFKLGDLKN
jgi:phage terminase Nu1 subunit (DNA packaging protein)